jgi:hypothetical protein
MRLIMSITGFMLLFVCILSLLSWGIIGGRMKRSQSGGSLQVRYMHSYFFFLAIFSGIMFLPQPILNVDPSQFPIAMAWAYVIGHIFLYIGFIFTLLLTFSMIPRLANKKTYAVVGASIGIVAITIVNIITMPFGKLPSYDFDRHLIILNAHPIVGVGIALFAAICVVPAAILMIVNGVRNPSARARSFLLGGGFIIVMIAGPMHDNAHTWQLYLVADVVSMIGLAVLTAGIMYRFEERIAPVQKRRAPLSGSAI